MVEFAEPEDGELGEDPDGVVAEFGEVVVISEFMVLHFEGVVVDKESELVEVAEDGELAESVEVGEFGELAESVEVGEAVEDGEVAEDGEFEELAEVDEVAESEDGAEDEEVVKVSLFGQ
jgi:hypothetical protein